MYNRFVSDSIIYRTSPGDVYEVPIGPFLGDMTDEVEKDYGVGARITEYVSTGPKSYAYSVEKSDGEIACSVKSKGFTLNYETGLILNMKAMRDMVMLYAIEGITDRLELTGRGIRRTKEHEIVTRTIKKTITVTANKRKLCENFLTFPYGYM